jgi:predicted TIM-barrel fold metal-dependent hydrolase
MKNFFQIAAALLLVFPGLRAETPASQKTDVAAVQKQANAWRAEHRLIDLHQHINYTEEHHARAIRILDQAGIGLAVNLSGGTVTRKEGAPSAFERNKALADRLYPGRFLHYFNLDYSRWNEPDFSEWAAQQVDEAHRLGAAGLKEFKRLGLYLRDREGNLIKIDDPKLDPVWRRCGELGMPISIHVADPRAFWLPYDPSNERWTELKDHKSWWFGNPDIYPPREELLEALNRVIGRHPKTTFVCLHFANNAEDIDWVEQSLDRYPNMNADLAARIPEIGRHDPAKVHQLFVKHPDRIFFATDFQVYNRLILGSGGSGPGPTDEDAIEFFKKHWRWLETHDRGFAHMTPIQGDWTIDAIGLPADVLRKIYFDNARKLLARSLPKPVLEASRVGKDFVPDGLLKHPAWAKAAPVRLEYQSRDSSARPELSTTVRALWSDDYLYLAFAAPFTELTVFEPADLSKERMGLWERDVVEAFIGPDPSEPRRYLEFEVAPTGEKLDVAIQLPEKDFAWSSGFQAAVHVDHGAKIWTAEWRIPLSSLLNEKPAPGAVWNLNLYRVDRANNAYLAWSPTLTNTFHAPDRFGRLRFAP